jgi:hypothetical protein
MGLVPLAPAPPVPRQDQSLQAKTGNISRNAAVILGLTAITCAGVFYTVNVASLAEPALTEMQGRIGDRLRTDSMRIASLQLGIRQRRAAAIALFGPASAFDVGALLYALTLVFHEAWLLSGAPKRKNAPELG